MSIYGLFSIRYCTRYIENAWRTPDSIVPFWTIRMRRRAGRCPPQFLYTKGYFYANMICDVATTRRVGLVCRVPLLLRGPRFLGSFSLSFSPLLFKGLGLLSFA